VKYLEIIAFNRRWAMSPLWLLNSLLVFIILAGLAAWQLHRAADKTHLLAQLQQSRESGIYAVGYVQTLPLAQADGRQVAGRGRWLQPQVWLLDNQVVNGRVGYDVIVPLQIDSVGQPMLVNLGWVAAPAGRSDLPRLQIPAEIEVRGLLRTRLGGFRLGQNFEDAGVWPMRIQQINIPAMDSYMRTALYPGLIYHMETSPFLVHYRPVVIPPERHRAYALQWGLLALAVLVVSVAASGRPLQPGSDGTGENFSDEELFRHARETNQNAVTDSGEFSRRALDSDANDPVVKH
jgi:surfeit locus 1 family protein